VPVLSLESFFDFEVIDAALDFRSGVADFGGIPEKDEDGEGRVLPALGG